VIGDASINDVLEHKTLCGGGKVCMYALWSHTRGVVITVEVFFFSIRGGKVQQYVSWKYRTVMGRVVV